MQPACRRGKRALPRGRYRLRVVLTDAAGNASAPVTLRFLVVGGVPRGYLVWLVDLPLSDYPSH